jgi:hypothetical protein
VRPPEPATSGLWQPEIRAGGTREIYRTLSWGPCSPPLRPSAFWESLINNKANKLICKEIVVNSQINLISKLTEIWKSPFINRRNNLLGPTNTIFAAETNWGKDEKVQNNETG